MSSEAAELLRKRALDFLEEADYLFERGKLDMSAFSLEQYCVLMAKYELLKFSGEFPHTHSLKLLLSRLVPFITGVKSLLSDKNIVYVGLLEDAYVASRYLPRMYDKAEVEELLKFVKEVFRPAVES